MEPLAAFCIGSAPAARRQAMSEIATADRRYLLPTGRAQMNAYSPTMQATANRHTVETPRVADALVQLKASHRLIEERRRIL